MIKVVVVPVVLMIAVVLNVMADEARRAATDAGNRKGSAMISTEIVSVVQSYCNLR